MSYTGQTRIFLDSGDPQETQQIKNLLGFLDGQTTNPSLVAKNPEVQSRIEHGQGFQNHELLDMYKDIVKSIQSLIPEGSVSVEVYADRDTTVTEMYQQAQEMHNWLPQAHIKLPTTTKGLHVARMLVDEDINVNMTLCFSQEQAAAVHQSTIGARKGQVYVSPFIGRLDDKGVHGLDLVENILTMYRQADSHVLVLAASIRHLDHLYACLTLGTDIITAGSAVYQEWHKNNQAIPDIYPVTPAEDRIPYKEGLIEKADIDTNHELTDVGIDKFAQDWNKVLS